MLLAIAKPTSDVNPGLKGLSEFAGSLITWSHGKLLREQSPHTEICKHLQRASIVVSGALLHDGLSYYSLWAVRIGTGLTVKAALQQLRMKVGGQKYHAV
eukprot:1576058-Amphidinium_carterae.1